MLMAQDMLTVDADYDSGVITVVTLCQIFHHWQVVAQNLRERGSVSVIQQTPVSNQRSFYGEM